MSLFSSHSSYLGVDIGSASIKVVELKNESGRPRLLTYGFAEEPIDIIHDSTDSMAKKIASLLVKICQAAKVSTKKTIAAFCLRPDGLRLSTYRPRPNLHIL